MPSYAYALYPFSWIAPQGGLPGYHAPPAGAACVLDFRPLAEQAKAAQSGGYGLFAWASGAPGDAVSLGSGYAPELVVDNAARVELKAKLGLSANPAGNTLADCLSDVLGSLADPTGLSGPKPLMPTQEGVLELHLEGRSRIWSQQIDATELLSASPKGRHNRIRDVIRADLDEAERAGGAPVLQKALGAWLLKLGVPRAEVRAGAGGKKSQFDRLISNAVKAKHGANARPADPQTQLVETWPNASVASLNGTTQSLPWVTNGTTMTVSGSRLRGQSATQCFARCTTPVSSADHWADAVCYNAGPVYYHAGPCVRMASGAVTSYWAVRFVADNNVYLLKHVSGTQTLLATAAQAGTLNGNVVRCSANGSTIASIYDGAAKSSVTDTSITGNLFGGVQSYPIDAGSVAGLEVGQVTIDDGLSGSGGTAGTLNRGVGP